MLFRTAFGAAVLGLLVAAAGLLSPAASAQGQSSIQGRITNDSGMPVADCRVVARDTELGDVFVSASSDAEGWYVLPVPVGGSYALVALVTPTGGRYVLAEGEPLRVDSVVVTRDLTVPFRPPTRRATEKAGGADRLFLAFAEDPAMVRRTHVEAQAVLADLDTASRYESRLLAAFHLDALPRVELGIRGGYAGVSPDAGPDRSGAQDAEVWAKFHLFRTSDQQADVSVGALMTLPSGDDGGGIGTDAFQSKLFASGSYATDSAVFVFHGGVRTAGSGSSGGVKLGGRVSFSGGAGVLVPFSDRFSFVVEADYEGRRFDELEAESNVLVGLNWRLLPTAMFRFALAAGLEDASPDLQGRVGFAWTF